MRSLLGLLLMVWASQGFAEVDAERFKIALGGIFVAHNSTELFATSKHGLIGANIDFQNDLGMDTQTQSFRVDAHYRFNPKHKMEFSYYRIHTSATNVAQEEFEFNDATFSAGATLESFLEMDIYKLNYAYSFYHNEKVELAAGIGLHMIKTAAGINTSAGFGSDSTGSGIDTYDADESVKFLAPLPVFGFSMVYNATENLELIGSLDYFGLNIDDYSGYLTDLRIAAEYSFFDNFGVGAGLNFTVLDVEVKDERTVELNQGVSGVLLYLSYRY